MNWVYLLQWMLMVALLRMSYEMRTPARHSNPSSAAVRHKQPEKLSGCSDGRPGRVKRFTRLPPNTQERVLAYGENLLKYLEEESGNKQNSGV